MNAVPAVWTAIGQVSRRGSTHYSALTTLHNNTICSCRIMAKKMLLPEIPDCLLFRFSWSKWSQLGSSQFLSMNTWESRELRQGDCKKLSGMSCVRRHNPTIEFTTWTLVAIWLRLFLSIIGNSLVLDREESWLLIYNPSRPLSIPKETIFARADS